MRPRRVLQDTVASTIIPVDWRGGDITIIALPGATGNYDVAFTATDIYNTTLTPTWEDITGMSASTTQASATLDGSVTAVRVTLNSGDNVTVDISQSNT